MFGLKSVRYPTIIAVPPIYQFSNAFPLLPLMRHKSSFCHLFPVPMWHQKEVGQICSQSKECGKGCGQSKGDLLHDYHPCVLSRSVLSATSDFIGKRQTMYSLGIFSNGHGGR